MNPRRLADFRWADADGCSLVAVPVGSVEQHGPHLPLDTDTRIATAVAQSLSDAVLAPALEYGASGEHEGFPGTVSIGRETLTAVLVEHGRSMCRWASRVVFVNGHGGNAQALVDAVTLLRYEGRDVGWFACAVQGADAHAGRTETSLLLHLCPDRVDIGCAAAGVTDPMSVLMPRLRSEGVRAVSPTGVLGDPRGADAAEGRLLLREMQDALRHSVERWTPDEHGRL
ncbi:MAG: mycofactocin biosynthesis peptidyl-dipeptidase MftE [Rhodococcus sp. (in: high G+C Gram-positive bacteria)]